MKTLIFAVLASMASMTSAFFDIIAGPKFQGCEVICQGDGGLAEGPCTAHPGCFWADNDKKTKKKCWSSVGHLPCPDGTSSIQQQHAVQPAGCECEDTAAVSSQPDMSCSSSELGEPYETICDYDDGSSDFNSDCDDQGKRSIFEAQCNSKPGCFADGYVTFRLESPGNVKMSEKHVACLASDYAKSCSSFCSEVGEMHSEVLIIVERCKIMNCTSMTISGKDDGEMKTLLRDSSVVKFPDTLVTLEFGDDSFTDFLPRDDSRWSNSIKILILKDMPDMIFSENGVWPPALQSLEITGGTTIPANTAFPDSLEYINLAENSLTIVCKVWPAKLKVLDLKENKLTQITTSNTVLPDTLIKLDLSDNLLTLIDADLVWPTSLEELYLHKNKLASFACNMALLDSLVLIDLYYNALESLGADMVLPRESLTKLDLHANALTVIDGGFAWPSGLKILDMSRNKLEDLGGQISNLTSLKTILLFNNELTDIPAVWPDALDQIDLRSNELTKLPVTVWPSNLTILDISVNKLEELSENTTWPEKLLYLDLGTNLLTHLPTRMTWPGGLKWLSLTNNALEDLPKDMTWPAALLELFLNKNKLQEMPEVPWPNFLLILDLSINDLAKLPETPWPMFLEELILDHNKIRKLPDVDFPGLVKKITLVHNALEAIPNITSTAEMVLDLSDNSISTNNGTAAFNDALADFTTYTRLILANNAMTSLAGIIWPEDLTYLDLSGNDIRGLPPVNNQSWPSGLTVLNLDDNTWEDLMNTAAELQASSGANSRPALVTEGAAVLPFLDLRLPTDVPCESDTSIVLSASHENWNCLQVDGQPVAGSTGSVCTLECAFTAEGSDLISAKPASLKAAIELADKSYGLVWASGIPVTVVTSVALWQLAKPRSVLSPDWALVGLGSVFFSAVDVMTDWAFYFLEISSLTFEDRYTCNATAQNASVNYECTVNGEPSSFSCDGYGLLRGNCGRIGNSAVDATGPENECECNDLMCDDANLCKNRNQFEQDVFQVGTLATSYIFLPNLNPTYLACWLKMGLTDSDETTPYVQSSSEVKAVITNWVAGDCRDGGCTIEDGATYNGAQDIPRDYNVRATTVEECARLCLGDVDCDHFNYYNQPGCLETKTNLAPILELFSLTNCLDKIVNPYYGYNCGAGDFEDLDDNVDETCGFLSPNEGNNECECHDGGVCKETDGSRGSCVVDGTYNDYKAFKRACLVCNIVATILWIAHSITTVRLGRACDEDREDNEDGKVAEGDAVDSDATKRLRKQNAALTIITMLAEDVPQVFFSVTFIRYMGHLNPDASGTNDKTLVVISFVLSALSILSVPGRVAWQLCCPHKKISTLCCKETETPTVVFE